MNKHVLILIPLILSSFTHLWNHAQFPSFHVDEGVYIRRALHTLSGLDPHDPDTGLITHSPQRAPMITIFLGNSF